MRKGKERMEGKGEGKGRRKWRSQVETNFSGELSPTETN